MGTEQKNVLSSARIAPVPVEEEHDDDVVVVVVTNARHKNSTP